MKYYATKKNFLAIAEEELYNYKKSKYVIQSAPYEHTSSYLQGSAKGPAAIIKASHYVELYDEELDQETYKKGGICTLYPMEFGAKTNEKAVKLIEKETEQLLKDKKFPITLGAEHTISLGCVKALLKHHSDFSVLQIDRVQELGVSLTQIGIRAQCIEEAELIKKSKHIHTYYAHQVRANHNWMADALSTLKDKVYITIDADGFDPSVVPNVGTAEPNGLFWNETLQFLKQVIASKQIIGLDVVEIAPQKGSILSEYTMAKMVYRLIGYLSLKK
jgi:agmatinase